MIIIYADIIFCFLVSSELAMYDAVAGRDTSDFHSPLTTKQLAGVETLAKQFVAR